ncbi:flagellar basal body P-ring biosynthesis protein, putative [Babesia ovata]|uniref:Flagellar basal body P-ring biosynthesis protein, putative n=1 Tax=Babesia ovata TaxID=189622 RepID=A0A2H6K6U4_9APIC|nr:flagellar basal body P-ring biosynthesis protein, putative [Babesia ovata]GBE58710.1 flagellar basal body P-ring biosynthesis protein, putative [Babesia ovata]
MPSVTASERKLCTADFNSCISPSTEASSHADWTVLRHVVVELLRDVRHDGVEQTQSDAETAVEGVYGALHNGADLGNVLERRQTRLHHLEVDVAELVQPEVFSNASVTCAWCQYCNGVTHLGDVFVQLQQNPAVFPLQGRRNGAHVDLKALDLGHGELERVPYLVAEVPAADDLVHIEQDGPVLAGQGQKAETQGISTAGGDALRELLLLKRNGLLDLPGGQAGVGDLFIEAFEGGPLNNLERVQHVALALAHLLTTRITHERVQVDLRERQLAHQMQGHHHHPRNPEEDDVVTGLEQGGGEELQEVGVLLVRPAQGGQREESGRKPCV